MKKMTMVILAGVIVTTSIMAGKGTRVNYQRTARFYPVKYDTLPSDTTHHPRDTTKPRLNDYLPK